MKRSLVKGTGDRGLNFNLFNAFFPKILHEEPLKIFLIWKAIAKMPMFVHIIFKFCDIFSGKVSLLWYNETNLPSYFAANKNKRKANN